MRKLPSRWSALHMCTVGVGVGVGVGAVVGACASTAGGLTPDCANGGAISVGRAPACGRSVQELLTEV